MIGEEEPGRHRDPHQRRPDQRQDGEQSADEPEHQRARHAEREEGDAAERALDCAGQPDAGGEPAAGLGESGAHPVEMGRLQRGPLAEPCMELLPAGQESPGGQPEKEKEEQGPEPEQAAVLDQFALDAVAVGQLAQILGARVEAAL